MAHDMNRNVEREERTDGMCVSDVQPPAEARSLGASFGALRSRMSDRTSNLKSETAST